MPVNLSNKHIIALTSQYGRWTRVSPGHRALGRGGVGCLILTVGKYGKENHSIGWNNDHLA